MPKLFTLAEKRELLNQCLEFLDEDTGIEGGNYSHHATEACLGICLGYLQSWIGVASPARPLKGQCEAALGNWEE